MRRGWQQRGRLSASIARMDPQASTEGRWTPAPSKEKNIKRSELWIWTVADFYDERKESGVVEGDETMAGRFLSDDYGPEEFRGHNGAMGALPAIGSVVGTASGRGCDPQSLSIAVVEATPADGG